MEFFLYNNAWWMFIAASFIAVAFGAYLVGRGSRND